MFRYTTGSLRVNSLKASVGFKGLDPRQSNPSFVPSDISGLQYWFKADALTLNDGDAVGSWTDSSGRNAHATQGSTSLKPVYKANIQNGKPAVRFDGSDDYLILTSSSFSSGGTIFFAGYASGSSYRRVISLRTTNYDELTGDTVIFSTAPNGDGMYRGWRGTGGTVTGFNVDTICLITFQISDAGGGNVTQVIRKNGSQINSANFAASTSNSPTNGNLAQSNRNGTYDPTGYVKGDFLEVIIYSGYIGDTNRNLVESYLNNKYAIY